MVDDLVGKGVWDGVCVCVCVCVAKSNSLLSVRTCFEEGLRLEVASYH